MITLNDIIEELNLEFTIAKGEIDREVTGGYASDGLSDVMANSQPGNIWITSLMHVNIIAVATLKELTAIIMVNGRVPEDDTLKKAEAEKMPILISKYPAFELIGRLYQFGIRSGSHDIERSYI